MGPVRADTKPQVPRARVKEVPQFTKGDQWDRSPWPRKYVTSSTVERRYLDCGLILPGDYYLPRKPGLLGSPDTRNARSKRSMLDWRCWVYSMNYIRLPRGILAQGPFQVQKMPKSYPHVDGLAQLSLLVDPWRSYSIQSSDIVPTNDVVWCHNCRFIRSSGKENSVLVWTASIADSLAPPTSRVEGSWVKMPRLLRKWWFPPHQRLVWWTLLLPERFIIIRPRLQWPYNYTTRIT